MCKVAIIKCDDYELEKVQRALEKGLEALGFNFPSLNKLLLKPNLLMKKRPDEAVTTHPNILKAFINIISKKVETILIADSPGGPYTERRLEAIYQATGIKELEKFENVKLNYDISSKEISCNGKILKKVSFISPYFESEAIISIAKLKTHKMAVFTGAVKNFFGLIPGGQKAELHFKLQEVDKFMDMLLDIYLQSRPILSIMDAIVGMEGEGPSAGNPRKIGAVLLSDDAIALDYVACKIIGLKVEEVPLLKAAQERGLLNTEKIEIVGDSLDDVLIEDFKVPLSPEISFIKGRVPNFIADILTSWVTPKPIFIHKKCIGCAECFNACPAQAIQMRERRPYVDLKKCIRCYCCHELCPVKAIKTKKSFLFEKILK